MCTSHARSHNSASKSVLARNNASHPSAFSLSRSSNPLLLFPSNLFSRTAWLAVHSGFGQDRSSSALRVVAKARAIPAQLEGMPGKKIDSHHL